MSTEEQNPNFTTSGYPVLESDPETGKKNIEIIDSMPVTTQTKYPSSVYVQPPPTSVVEAIVKKQYKYRGKPSKIQNPKVVNQIMVLAAQGMTGLEIAETIGVGKETWRKYTKVLARDHGLEFSNKPKKHGNRYTAKSVTKNAAPPAPPVVKKETHTGKLIGDMTVNEILNMAEAIKALTGSK